MEPSNTGERIVPNAFMKSSEDYLMYICSVASYRFAIDYVADKKVLDMGCGTGYGTNMLAEKCIHVTGVDVSPEAVGYAKRNHSKSNLEFKVINSIETEQLPFNDDSFDAVVSFQVIEHITEDKIYLEEIRRVLKPGCVVIVVTPDRSTRLFPFQKPWNAYHVREYSQTGLHRKIAGYFESVQIFNMGGDKEAIEIELSRTRRWRWLCLPFTLPFVPESARQVILKYLMKIYRMRPSPRKREPAKYSFDIDSIKISKSVKKSIHLIVVAYKKG